MAQACVKADQIPTIDPNILTTLHTAANGLITDATTISTAGADVAASWQGLSGVYSSPDSATLLLALTGVPGMTSSFGTDLTAVGKALQAYATELQPIATQLATVKTKAQAFTDRVKGDDSWDHDQDKVDENNGYIRTVDSLVVAQEAAERTCANAIEALIGGRQWHTTTADTPANDQNAYGYDSIPDNAPTPWGSTVSRKDSCPKAALTDIGRFGKGLVVDGLWGTVTALGGLVGVEGWDKFKQSWEGLGQLVIVTSPLVGTLVYGPEGEQQRLTALGKGLIGYDMWKQDPSRAAGATVFNIGSLFIPFAGEASAAADTAKAAKIGADGAELVNGASKAAKALDFTKTAAQTTLKATFDPVSLVPFEKLPGISDLSNLVKDHFGTNSINTAAINDLTHTGQLTDTVKNIDNIHASHFDTNISPTHGMPGSGDVTLSHGGIDVSGGASSHVPHAESPHLGATDPSREPALVGAHNPEPGLGNPHEPPAGGSGGGHDLSNNDPAHHPTARDDNAGSDGHWAEASGSHDHAGHDNAPADGTAHDPAAAQHADLSHPHDLVHDPAIPHPDPTLSGHHNLTAEEIRKHPDTGNQLDGSWEGKNGQHLDPSDNRLVQHYASEAATLRDTLKPQVMNEVGKVLPGHPFQGLDESAKYANSLKGKIATEMMRNPHLTVERALARVHDSVRFTVEIPPADYTNGVRQIVDNFHQRGWEFTKDSWNAWPGPGYRGLNTRWLDPTTGKVFEVQFHTAESFAKKSTEHGGYEELRLPNLTPEREAELIKLSHDHYADVEIPPGAETLQFKKEIDPPSTWSPR